ncbi:hypothetical protein EDI_296450 [Entamoeba dispar SAW760]|uniref:Transmembrane protein n=1 Tax=Entamoeba dispar (strain ATCC PRA-260 / SAW760) TaxID=370354 RepID=B0ER57_ENTDS|nr:uncharacterized protein EDI_296450 [Entamoeba dispar SAW760]EDR22986.1 hypothetical protein EDI_296450 [Entamoeba dispar SAW760]|eukprot:EDR22986.1 hypothetical protein EDI_296450 [Entamoeba dispar SAW760]
MLLLTLIAVSFAVNVPTTKSNSIDHYIQKIRLPSCSFTSEMCKTCKNHIVLQKDYCDNPKKDDQKCICSAFKGNWKNFFEDVEDTIRTPEQACAYVCSNGTIPLEGTNSLKSGALVSNGSTMVMILASLLMMLVFV